MSEFIKFKEAKGILQNSRSIYLNGDLLNLPLQFDRWAYVAGIKAEAIVFYKENPDCSFKVFEIDNFFHYKNLIIISNSDLNFTYLPWILKYELY